MTNSKSTKRALLSSAFAILMCVAMLIGTTFAWFTDTASTGVNKIQAGNLDIEVEYTLDGETWNNLDEATDIFQKGLWEPGHTEVVAFKFKNNGSLALKYSINMNIVDETVGLNKSEQEYKLSDYLKVKTLSQEASQIGDICIGMAFSARNDALGYHNNGKLYHEILSKSYLTAFRYTESELLEILGIERSTFYDRKKEAIMLLGIALWGYAIPAFRGIFDVEGDEDEIPEFFINTAQSDLCPTKVR